MNRGRAPLITGEPQNDRDRKFCEAWLLHFDVLKAYGEAGFKIANTTVARQKATIKYLRFAPYLQKLAEARRQQLGAQTVLRDTDIINEMIGIGFVNPQDFMEAYEEPNTDAKGEIIDGTHTAYRPIPLMQLPAHLARCISKVTFIGGAVVYQLPATKEKLSALTNLGKNFGLFLDTIIEQKHLHLHQHKHLSLRGVDPARLEALEGELIEMIGPSAYVMLGLPAPEKKDA